MDKVIVIYEENHGFIGIVKSKEDVINFLINKNWLRDSFVFPCYDPTIRCYTNPSIIDLFGKNWRDVFRKKTFDELQTLLEDNFEFSEEEVYSFTE